MQHEKFQIYTLKINTIFCHCKKFRLLLNKGLCTRVANCLFDHEKIILVLIIRIANKHWNNTRMGALAVSEESSYTS